MKKILKISAIALIGLIIFLTVFLIWNNKRQLLSKDYQRKITTGGDIEAAYAQYGAYEVSYFEQAVLENYKKYEIWYPSEMTQSSHTYPVIVINNGTGMHASRQKAAYNRLASWGFIVIANEEEYAWNGFAADMSLQYLLRANEQKDSIFYQHINTEQIGVTGHSQGGAACINTVTQTKHADMYKAAFLVSPPVEELAFSLEWDYDISQVTIPVALFAGTGDTDATLISPLDGMLTLYEHAVSSPYVLFARKTGYDHGETAIQTDGYMTAWFCCWLKGDKTAAQAFIGDTPEILQNTCYQDQKLTVNK